MKALRELFGLMLLFGLLFPLLEVSLLEKKHGESSYDNPFGEYETFSPNAAAFQDWDVLKGAYEKYYKKPFYFGFVYIPLGFFILAFLAALRGKTDSLGIEQRLIREYKNARKTR